MWERKSSSQILTEKEIRLLRAILVEAAAVCLIQGMITRHILSGWVSGSAASLWPWAAVGSVAAIIVAWMARASAKRRRTLVCAKCNRVKMADNQHHCHCGGDYFNLNEMKWLAEPIASGNPTLRFTANGTPAPQPAPASP